MPKYSDEQWRQLTNVNAVDVATALGLEFDMKSSDRKAYHVEGYGGLFVWKDGSGFYHSSENAKGNAVALVQHIQKCSYREALDFINDNVMNGSCSVVSSENKKAAWEQSEKEKAEKQANFKLPKADHKMARAYAYLIQRRKIDPDIVKFAAGKGLIFQDEAHGNVGFVGMDKAGTPRYCALRGTSFVPNAVDIAKQLNLHVSHECVKLGKLKFYKIDNRSDLYITEDKAYFYDNAEHRQYLSNNFIQIIKGCDYKQAAAFSSELIKAGQCAEVNLFKGEVDGSDKRFGFCLQGTNRKLLVFEAAIDVLSYATLQKAGRPKTWQQDTKLSLGGCSMQALQQHLTDYPNCYDEICVCTDNDEAGNHFAEEIRKAYGNDYEVSRHAPTSKDWNDDLKKIRALYDKLEANIQPNIMHLGMANAVSLYYAQQDELSDDCEIEP